MAHINVANFWSIFWVLNTDCSIFVFIDLHFLYRDEIFEEMMDDSDEEIYENDLEIESDNFRKFSCEVRKYFCSIFSLHIFTFIECVHSIGHIFIHW